jgi:hypothetical protein
MSSLRAIALSLMSALAFPAAAGTTQLALPTQQPDESPSRPVGEPDVPPLDIDFYFDSESGHEEAWPSPSATEN